MASFGWTGCCTPRLEDVPLEQLEESAHFFAHYKDLEKKNVEVIGWASQEAAHERIVRAGELYRQRHP